MGLKIRLYKQDTELLKRITQQRLLSDRLKTWSKERSVNSQQRRIELIQKASTRTRTRGLLDETSLVRRIVVAPKTQWNFFHLLYPNFILTDDIKKYRPSFSGIIYTGIVTETVIERLEFIKNYIVLTEMFDIEDKENYVLKKHLGEEKVVKFFKIRDYITWFYPKENEKKRSRIGHFQKEFSERMPEFLNLMLKSLLLKKGLPTKKQMKDVSVYPLFVRIGDRDTEAFTKTLFEVMDSMEAWKVESSIMTFLGRVMDGDVTGNSGGYGKLVRQAQTTYGHRVKKAVLKYVQSKQDVFWKLLELHRSLTE